MNANQSSPVLLVEDDANDVFLIRTAFDLANLSVPLNVAENGSKAVDYLAGEGEFSDRSRFPIPRLVLLDLKLPGISGFDVLKWIRAEPSLCSLNVVVLSSSNQDYDVQEAYRRGANAYLVKPSGMPGLLDMVKAIDAFWLKHNRQITLKLWELSGVAPRAE